MIYLIGTSGHPNYGDELITATWLRYLAHTLPDAEVWLDSPRPGASAVLFRDIHPRLRCVDTLFNTCWNAPTDNPSATLEFGERVVYEPGIIPREATGVEDLSRVDLVHILGGGYINAIWPSHLALIGAARGVAQRYQARTAITGAGLTPLVNDDAKALGEALSTFDIVDVRDDESLKSITPFVSHASNSGDDAFLAIDERAYDYDHDAPVLLCLQTDLIELPLEKIADYVVRTLRFWGDEERHVALVECLPPSDAKVLALLEPYLPNVRLLPFSELWRQGFPCGNGKRWISTRFHPHLLAAAAGNWGVAIPISANYYLTKHKSLTTLGSGWALATDLDDPIAPQPIDARFNGNVVGLKSRKLRLAQAIADLALAKAVDTD